MNRSWIMIGLCLCLSNSLIVAQDKVLSPDDFLPYKHGTEFTPHHLLVDYYEHVASLSPNVKLERYGYTNEDRPLIMAIISSEKNLNNLDKIRNENLINTSLKDGNSDPTFQKAIVWLSFSVHGNEAAGSESAVPVLYELVTNPKCKEWLENTVVILDPSINPDGYSRYTHWNRRMSNTSFQPDNNSIEHHEPWPGGRTNHYFFDLNRDWAWLTQVESQQRLLKYRSWMPHVHADLHEMGYNSPYYFAPAAQPYHEYISKFQREFQFDIGKNHAKYFDEEGWLYFTREVFDLLYPSYGDTYPIYNGSIGMTYEQGGSGYAGLGIVMDNDDLLTLADRIAHHKTTALSTIEISSKNKDRLVSNFKQFFEEAKNNPPGKYKSFIIKDGLATESVYALLNLLDQHEITFGSAPNMGRVNAFEYKSGTQKQIGISANDIVISAHQPMGKLAQILLEPEPELVDSLTYDITAWSLMYAYGIEAYASSQRIDPVKILELNEPDIKNSLEGQQKVVMVRWGSLASVQFLAAAMKQGIRARSNPRPIETDGQVFDRGTLIFTYADNKKLGEEFSKTITDLASEHNLTAYSTASGFFEKGPDLGSNRLSHLGIPKIMVLTDEGTSSNSYGQIWHYFDQTIQYPTSNVAVEDFGGVDLDDYDVLILPEGWYSDINDTGLEKMKDFTRSGGKIIAVGRATRLFEGETFDLKRYVEEDNKTSDEEIEEQRKMNARYAHYEDRIRSSLNRQIPGAIVQMNLDNSHPLAYGLNEVYHSLKTSSINYEAQESAWNVGKIPEDFKHYGFIGEHVQEKMDNTAVFIHKDMGSGSIIYLVDNPLFRSFWYQGILLFSNAVFQVE